MMVLFLWCIAGDLHEDLASALGCVLGPLSLNPLKPKLLDYNPTYHASFHSSFPFAYVTLFITLYRIPKASR